MPSINLTNTPIPAGTDSRCPYDGCPKQSHAYARREDLDDHIRSKHTGERFVCPDCTTPFIRLRDLGKHSRTVHKGEKPFVCDPAGPAGGCGKRFPSQYNLNRHRKGCSTVDAQLAERAEDTTTLFRGVAELGVEDATTLSRDIADLRSDPSLKARFAEILESHVGGLELPVLGDNYDISLARCAAVDTRPCAEDIVIDAHQPYDSDLPLGDEGIDVALYQRLVRLFRSRRPRTLAGLLGDVWAAIRQANIARVLKLIDLSWLQETNKQLVERMLERMENPNLDSAFVGRLRIGFLGSEVVLLVDRDNVLYNHTDLATATPSDLSSRLLRWAAELLVDQAWRWQPMKPIVPRDERRQRKIGRAAKTFYEAHCAASCIASLSAGHTDSVDESVCSRDLDRDFKSTATQHELPKWSGSQQLEAFLAGVGPGSLGSEPLPPDPSFDASALERDALALEPDLISNDSNSTKRTRSLLYWSFD